MMAFEEAHMIRGMNADMFWTCAIGHSLVLTIADSG